MRKNLLIFVLFLFLAVLFSEILSQAEALAQYVDTAWVVRYNGPADSTDVEMDLITDGSGNICVTGYSMGNGANYDYVTIKYYPNGDTAWVRRYDGPANGNDRAFAITVDDSDNIYVTGESYGMGTDFDYATMKYSPGGDELWVKRYNGPGNSTERAYDLAVDDSGNVYVTGASVGSGTDYDYATIKYFPDGDTAWVRRYNGTRDSVDRAYCISVDDSGNVYLTGWTSNTGANVDYGTIKYYPNGDTAWVRVYNGPGNGSDMAWSITVDDSRNVYVTGPSDQDIDTGDSSDYATIKYDSDGDTAWIRTYDGPGNSGDLAEWVEIDGNGNIYVTGRSWGTTTGYDYATIKYDSSGNENWVRRYDGPANNDDYAQAMVIDGSGNIYVAGYIFDNGTSYDYATIKYYPNGDTAWTRRYNGPGNSNDKSYLIVLDNSENVYVAGYSTGAGTGWDYATIKYAPLQRNDTLLYTAYSPVDIIVTDPLGDSIGVDFNTIPGASYDTLTDYNGDEELDDRVTIPEPLIGDYTVRVVGEPGSGGGSYTLAVKLNGNEDTPMVSGAPAPGPGEVDTIFYPVTEDLRGDANTDGSTSISDVIFLINYLFKGGPPPVPLSIGDANCCKEGDGSCTVVNLSVSDVIYLINYLFKGGKAPCS